MTVPIKNEKIKEQLTALADLAIDCYRDFKKRGLLDEKGLLLKKSATSQEES